MKEKLRQSLVFRLFIVVAGCLLLISVVGVIQMIRWREPDRGTIFDNYTYANCAKFEYIEEENEKYLYVDSGATGNPLLTYFYGLKFSKTDEEADDQWLYKITYNWNEYCDNCEETIVLLSEDGLSVNGFRYVPESSDPEEYYQLVLDQIAYLYEEYGEYKENVE